MRAASPSVRRQGRPRPWRRGLPVPQINMGNAGCSALVRSKYFVIGLARVLGGSVADTGRALWPSRQVGRVRLPTPPAAGTSGRARVEMLHPLSTFSLIIGRKP